MNEPTLEDAGFAPRATSALPAEQAQRLAACLDIAAGALKSGELPLLWHWVYFLPIVPTAALGPDGHPRRRPEVDDFPHRMWVGGRIAVDRAPHLDTATERTSRLVRAELKHGSSGPFWLMTIEHVIAQGEDVCVREEQDLVLRGPSSRAATGEAREAAPADEWVEERIADPVLLFRFSAITANAHRIHYDLPYATTAEGYPSLVVHGPLTALLLADFAARCSQRPVREVSFRAHAPHFANQRFWLTGHALADGVETAVVRADHTTAMTLTAR